MKISETDAETAIEELKASALGGMEIELTLVVSTPLEYMNIGDTLDHLREYGNAEIIKVRVVKPKKKGRK